MSVDTSWWTDEGPRHWALTNCGGTSSKWCCSLVERTVNDAGADVSSRGTVAESTCETSSCCCSGNEGAASNVGASVTSSVVESESTCSPGGRFGDLERIGMGMVNESSSASESESSCMNLESGCDGDE